MPIRGMNNVIAAADREYRRESMMVLTTPAGGHATHATSPNTFVDKWAGKSVTGGGPGSPITFASSTAVPSSGAEVMSPVACQIAQAEVSKPARSPVSRYEALAAAEADVGRHLGVAAQQDFGGGYMETEPLYVLSMSRVWDALGRGSAVPVTLVAPGAAAALEGKVLQMAPGTKFIEFDVPGLWAAIAYRP